MEDTMVRISEDEFYEKFRPIKNHLDKDASWDGTLFETYGEELMFCFELSKKENCVWTIIECDDTEFDPDEDDEEEIEEEEEEEEEYEPSCLYIISGFHLVNRVGFMITENPYTEDTEVKLDL